MTSAAVQLVIKRLAKASGVNRLYPHLLRHTYATLFLINGGDIFLLQRNLGHTTLEMVRRTFIWPVGRRPSGARAFRRWTGWR